MRDKPRAIRRRPRLSLAMQWAIDEHYRQELASLQAVDEGVRRSSTRCGAAASSTTRCSSSPPTTASCTASTGIPSGKVLPYEESIRVPLLMRGPGVPRGEVRDQLVANVDIAPTVLEAAGASAPWIPDGQSLFASCATRSWRRAAAS